MKALPILILTIFSACSKQGATDNPLIGKWKLVSYSASDCSDPANNLTYQCPVVSSCDIIKFEANGSYSDLLGTGTWSPYASGIFINASNSYPAGAVGYSVKGTSLTLTSFIGVTRCNMTYTYTKLSQ